MGLRNFVGSRDVPPPVLGSPLPLPPCSTRPAPLCRPLLSFFNIVDGPARLGVHLPALRLVAEVEGPPFGAGRAGRPRSRAGTGPTPFLPHPDEP